MSLADYEDFVFRACHVLDDDPVDHWRRWAAELQARAERARLGARAAHRRRGHRSDRRRRGPDLARARRAPEHARRRGLHEPGRDGDQRRRSASGFPAVFDGREIDDVRLRFEDGRVVAARGRARRRTTCARCSSWTRARACVGEIAFGLNYEIDRFTRNILFDEKIGGTMHMALGLGFADLGGQNRSALHLGPDLRPARRGRGLRGRGARLAQRAVPARDHGRRACRTCPIAVTSGWRTCSSASAAGVREGDLVTLESSTLAAPLLRELYRRCSRPAAHPLPRIALERAEPRTCSSSGATSSSTGSIRPALDDIETVDVRIVARRPANTKRLSNVDPARQAPATPLGRGLAEPLPRARGRRRAAAGC